LVVCIAWRDAHVRDLFNAEGVPMHRLFAIGTAIAVLFLAAGEVPAHEGHEHGPPPPPARMAARGEAQSEALELVAVAEGNAIAIYLDRFISNEPVGRAEIEVETPTGPVTARAEAGDVFRIAAPWLEKPGKYDLIFTVTTDADTDVLPVTLEIPDPATDGSAASTNDRLRQIVLLAGATAAGFGFALVLMAIGRRRKHFTATAVALIATLLVVTSAVAHEGHEHAAAPTLPIGRDLSQRLPDGSVFVPKATQRILAIRTTMTADGRFQRTIELPGRIIPDPNASGLVQASAGGRLSPPPGGFPRLGTRVSAGDVLAHVTAPLQAIDISDMRQRQGELDQQISIVERRVTRYEPLAQSGAVSRVQLDEARLELQGLKERRAALDKVRREPEALIAPVDGVIADGTPVAGQMAQPNTVVFQIVDPARLWVEALSFDALAAATATAQTAQGHTLALIYRGSGFSDRNQSIPVHFAIDGDVSRVRVGQFVTVFASTGDEMRGIALPRAAVVRSVNGQDLVYEHVSAERFLPRPVRIEPLDGERVLIAAGITAEKRIVVQGAELIDQVR
jgi:cobalt-zinc-cadmium efflux system membrane fusion protein